MALRSHSEALVLTGHNPGELLDGLDKVLACNRQSEELFTTVCCCWISPDRERVTVLAGHPPPLLARDGGVEVVEVPAGPALGILDGGAVWEPGRLEVGEDWTLLCYTDGLVEGRSAPGSRDRFGIEALVAAAAGLLGGGGLDDGCWTWCTRPTAATSPTTWPSLPDPNLPAGRPRPGGPRACLSRRPARSGAVGASTSPQPLQRGHGPRFIEPRCRPGRSRGGPASSWS